MRHLAAILLAFALAALAARGQTPTTIGVAVSPANYGLVKPTNFFAANSNRLQQALGVTNIPAVLAARAYQIATIAALTNLDWSTVPALATNGAALALARTTSGDRGGGLLLLQPTSTATIDGGITFGATPSGRWVRWRPEHSRRVSADWWGAAGDGTTDDTAAITAAGSAIQSQGGGELILPGPLHLVRGGDPGAVVCYWSNLTGVRIVADAAKIITDDFGTNTFLRASLTIAGTTASAVTPTAHGLIVGNTVIVRDATDSGYDGPYTVTAAGTTTNFAFALSGYSTPTLSATGLVRKAHQGNVLFRLKACTNVDFGSLHFSGVVQPVHSQYRLGWIVAQPVYGSTDLRGHLRINGAAYGLWSGDYDIATGDCDAFDFSVAGDDIGYPVSLWDSGHRSRYRIVANRVHRGAYVGGVHDAHFDIDVTNPDVAGILITHQPLAGTTLTGCENIDADVCVSADREISLHGVGASRYIAIIGAYNIDTPATHRNIRLRLRGKNAINTTGLQILGYSSQHRLDGLELSGFVDQRGITTNQVRHDLYVDQTGSAGMTFRNIAIRDLTFLHPADGVGSYNSTFHADHIENDLLVDRYVSGMTRNFTLPAGRRVTSTPSFPDFTADSFEGAQLQRLGGGLTIAGNTVSNAIAASPGAGDLTIAWAGTVPGSGNFGLFALSSDGAGVASGALGAQITNGTLVVRLYGSTLGDYRQATVAAWQSDHAGKIASLGIVRNPSGLRIWTDGHENAITETSSGTAPSWTNAISATWGLLGPEATNTWYVGTVYRWAGWNVDRSADWPALATHWGAGQSSLGDSANTIDSSTLNGSFETAGSGGADIFGTWTEGALGSSIVTNSSTASAGSQALAFVVDSSNSYAAAYLTNAMTIGGTYRISLDARVLSGGSGGAINLVGATDGETTIQITSSWATYTVTKVWGATTFLVKRSDAADRTILVDNIRVQRVGALWDLDFSQAPADLLTGQMPGISGTASRMVPRGPAISTDRGDASVTLRPGIDAAVQWFASPLTTGRTVTFSTNGARAGDQFRVVRHGAGAGSLTAGALTISSNRWADFIYTGAGWTNIATGDTR